MDTAKAYMMARDLTNHFLGKDWGIHFCNEMEFTLGQTATLMGQIRINRPYVRANDETHVLDTILHEIAHGIVMDGHTEEWRQKCLEIGGNGHERDDESSGDVPFFVVRCPRYCPVAVGGFSIPDLHKLRNGCPQCGSAVEWHINVKGESRVAA